MFGTPIQPHPVADEDEGGFRPVTPPAPFDLEFATALQRLAQAGADKGFVRVPPTVRLFIVSRLRTAGVLETLAGLQGEVQASFTDQGRRLLPKAIARANSAAASR